MKGIESMWNDHWWIMKPAYFIIWFSFNNNFYLFCINMWSTPAVWKQHNKTAVLLFFLVNSPLIYILFSMSKSFTLYPLHPSPSFASYFLPPYPCILFIFLPVSFPSFSLYPLHPSPRILLSFWVPIKLQPWFASPLRYCIVQFTWLIKSIDS